MTDQKLEPGSTYKVEAEFTVEQHLTDSLAKDTQGRWWALGLFDKIEKVRDRFEKGALYEDGFSGRVLRRTGFDEPFGRHWAEAGGKYVHSEEVDEEQLTRLYREGEK